MPAYAITSNYAGKVMDHLTYPARCRTKTEAELRHTIADAKSAMAANPENPNNGYYADEVCYCADELARRNREAAASSARPRQKARTAAEKARRLAGLTHNEWQRMEASAMLDALRSMARALQVYRREIASMAGATAWPAYLEIRPTVAGERRRLARQLREACHLYDAAHAAEDDYQ